ncbi:MAG TPA: hypothetical protein VFZ58_05590 [Candidatus Saccharimonadales bacterium]
MDPYSNHTQSQPSSRWPLSKKATIVIVVAVVIVLVGVIIAAALLNKSQPGSNQTSDNSSLYYDRPGYERSKLGTAISDPMALKITANNQAVNYQGQAVIQACNVLTLDDITNEDLLIKANTLPTPYSRVYNDGVGKASYGQVTSSSLSSLGLGMDVNSCNYVLEDENSASIGVNVYQPFAVPLSVVDQEVQREYAATGSLEGLEVFKKKESSSTPGSAPKNEYILRKGGSAVYISLALPSGHASKEQALLVKTAKKFNTELAQPTGVSTVSYDSPPLTKPYVRACGLLTNDDMKELSGKDASPLAREGIAPSTDLLQLNSAGKQKMYPAVQNECVRATPREGTSLLGGGVSLTAQTISYLEPTPAEAWLDAQRKTNQNNRENMDVDDIADEAVAYIDVTGDGHVIFRKGRVVVDISLEGDGMRSLSLRSLKDVASKLAPIAQNMAERVKE